jgi:hypothetical protein
MVMPLRKRRVDRWTMKNKGLILAALLLGLFSQAFAAPSTPPIKEAKSAKVTNGYDPTIRAEHQRALYYQLWAEKLPLQETAVSVQLTAEEAAGLSDKANGGFTRSPLELRQRVGIVKPVSHQVDLRGFSADGLPLAPTPAATAAAASGHALSRGVPPTSRSGLTGRSATRTCAACTS